VLVFLTSALTFTCFLPPHTPFEVFFFYLFLKLDDPVIESFRPWRASRDINIYRQKGISTLNSAVCIEDPPAAGTTAHRYDITRQGHLVIDSSYNGGHFFCDCTGKDNDIRLP